jgi:2-oxoglutarate dehydrogenase E2 component (dihydrolipoamide succinyltransferase)
MPKVIESLPDGKIIRWLVREGEGIREGVPLFDVEAGSISRTVQSQNSGILLKILVSEGMTVPAGTALAWIGRPGDKVLEETKQVAVRGEVDRWDLGFVSPVVARLVAEHGINIFDVAGSGKDGRVTKKDVLAFIEAQEETENEAEIEPDVEQVEVVLDDEAQDEMPTPGIETIVAEELAELEIDESTLEAYPGEDDFDEEYFPAPEPAAEGTSVPSFPYPTIMMEADLGKITAHKHEKKRAGYHLTHALYFSVAAIAALKTYPAVNASWGESGITRYDDVNIGFLVSQWESELVLPVIMAFDKLSFRGMIDALSGLSVRVQEGLITENECGEETFIIANQGKDGALFSTPLLKPLRGVIFGVGTVYRKPVVVEKDAVAVHPVVNISLTYDLRVINNFAANRFLARIKEVLENWV